ncbi:MAG: forespore capture DNA-binding protein RefZ [Sporolactobacillus sp.]
MRMKETARPDMQKTKQTIIDAALRLFDMRGFDGTPVRAIAEQAGVNVALVSYYFGGKNGLREWLMTSFFESYLQTLEAAVNAGGSSSAVRLNGVAAALVDYHQAHFALARFVHREMTIDNQLVRELMSSYLMKEKFLLLRLMYTTLPEGSTDPIYAELTALQFRGLLLMPFQQPQYFREVFFMQPTDAAFTHTYMRFVDRWISRLLAPADGGKVMERR